MARKLAQPPEDGIVILLGKKERVGGAFLHNLHNQEVSVESGPGVTALGIRAHPDDDWCPPHARLPLFGARLIQVRTAAHGGAPTESTFALSRRQHGLHLARASA